MAFSRVDNQPMPAETLKQRPEVGQLLPHRGACHQAVIQVDEKEGQITLDRVHKTHKVHLCAPKNPECVAQGTCTSGNPHSNAMAITEEKVERASAGNSTSGQQNTSACKSITDILTMLNMTEDTVQRTKGSSINQLTCLYVHQQTIATQKICTQNGDSHLSNSIDSACICALSIHRLAC